MSVFDNKPTYRLEHYNGSTHAEFQTANAAYACQQGLALDRGNDGLFYFEDAVGSKVVLKDQTRYPGHAYAILAALDRAKEAGR